MPNGSGKPGVQRQTHLPLSRALIISINSLKIRFGRSIITAGGVFLGIAFLSTVLTQSLMQWPVPEKIDAGFVRMDGQINGPGDIEVWKPVPVQEGIRAGIPSSVLERVAAGSDTFDLREVVEGRLEAQSAAKNLERARKELEALKRVPKSLYSGPNAEKEISVKDAVKAGVPRSVATRLAGEGKGFSGSALAEAVEGQPDVVRRWQKRLDDRRDFLKVSQESIDKLGNPQVNPDTPYVLTVAEALERAKGLTKEADVSNVMIVNKNGRKIALNFKENQGAAEKQKLSDGDYVLIPDRNSRYRTIWLVVMSLLVCTVGITNSMLMSVTERFKEIGTMKCLGAMDKFVVTLFMLESGMMGIVASILGWAVGFVLIVLVAGFSKGWDVVANIGLLDIVRTFVVCVVVGLALTLIATIIPAKRAADMPAAMALRSEI